MWSVHCPVSTCVASLLSCKRVPAFGPFAVLSVRPVSLLLITLFFPPLLSFLHSLIVTRDWLIPFAVAVRMLLQLLQVTQRARIKKKRIFAYIRSILLRPSWKTFISYIDHHYEQVMAEYLVLLFTIFNYLPSSSYIYIYVHTHTHTHRKCDGHCHVVDDNWLVCGNSPLADPLKGGGSCFRGFNVCSTFCISARMLLCPCMTFHVVLVVYWATGLIRKLKL
jgi:hypothetical protein